MQLSTLIKNKLLYFLHLILVITSTSFHAMESNKVDLLREEQTRKITELQAEYLKFSQESEKELIESFSQLKKTRRQEVANQTNLILVGFSHGKDLMTSSIYKYDPIENAGKTDDELYEEAKNNLYKEGVVKDINQVNLDFVCRPIDGSEIVLFFVDDQIRQLNGLRSKELDTIQRIEESRKSISLLDPSKLTFDGAFFSLVNFLCNRMHMRNTKGLGFIPSTYAEKFEKEMENESNANIMHNTVVRAQSIQNHHNLKRLLSFTLPVFVEELKAKTDVNRRKIIRAHSLFPSFLSGKSGHSDAALEDIGFKFTGVLKKLKEPSLEKFGNEIERILRIAENGKDQGNLPYLTELELKNIEKVGKKLEVDAISLFSKYIPKTEEIKPKTKRVAKTTTSQLPVVTKPREQMIQIKEPQEEEQKVDYVDPFKYMKPDQIFIERDTRHKMITGNSEQVSEVSSYQVSFAEGVQKQIKRSGAIEEVTDIVNAVRKLYEENKGNMPTDTNKILVGTQTYLTEHPHLSGKYEDVNFIVKSKGNTLLPWDYRLYFKVDHETKNLVLFHLGHL